MQTVNGWARGDLLHMSNCICSDTEYTPCFSLQTVNGWARGDLLRLLGSMEAGSSHPLAAAVIGYAAAQVRCWAPRLATVALWGSHGSAARAPHLRIWE